MGELVIEGLDLRYGPTEVVRDLELTVNDGELVSLLGPSGAGKTTILKAVAGLIQPVRGDVRIDGRSVLHLPPERRDAVMVFQKPLLFPFMSLWENVGFGLRMQRRLTADGRRRIDDILDLTGLTDHAGRRPHELSGGQQQRASLARALVLQPAVLLLDEPLSHLDATLRGQMRELIVDIQRRTRTTTLFVTHDQAEALMISGRIGLLLDGRLRQVGSPRDLFHRPADSEVARFFGGENFFAGRVRDGVFHSPYVTAPVGTANGGGGDRTATIRPEDVGVRKAEDGPGVTGRIIRTRFEGVATRVWIDCDGVTFLALSPDPDLRPGQTVRLDLPADRVRVFPKSSNPYQ